MVTHWYSAGLTGFSNGFFLSLNDLNFFHWDFLQSARHCLGVHKCYLINKRLHDNYMTCLRTSYNFPRSFNLNVYFSTRNHSKDFSQKVWGQEWVFHPWRHIRTQIAKTDELLIKRKQTSLSCSISDHPHLFSSPQKIRMPCAGPAHFK